MDFYISASISIIFMFIMEFIAFRIMKSVYELHKEIGKSSLFITYSLRKMIRDEKKQ